LKSSSLEINAAQTKEALFSTTLGGFVFFISSRVIGREQGPDFDDWRTLSALLDAFPNDPAQIPERDMIAGGGYGGQRVFILPNLGAVVVTTAGLYGDKASGLTALTTLNEFVFPAAAPH
jgi:hypothetical protein